MFLNNKETLSMRRSMEQNEIQIDDIETLVKIILIVVTYDFLIQKKSLLNKKSINHKETNSNTCTTTSSLTSNTSVFFIWMNY
jgi:hypothetical protein